MAFGHLHIRNEHGIIGENAAQNLLKQKGYTLLETNWKMGHLEVDIIAENKDVIVFAEVKTRSSVTFCRPEECVDEAKKLNIQHAANVYIKSHHVEKAFRFDIIGVLLNPDGTIKTITHLEDAFMPHMRTYRAGYTGEWRWHTKKYWKTR